MINLLTSLNTLPLVVKVGWVLWMTWGAAQVMWFRRARVLAPAVVSAPTTPVPARRRPPAARPVAPAQEDTIILPANASGSVLGLS